jgi:hypothetical protein
VILQVLDNRDLNYTALFFRRRRKGPIEDYHSHNASQRSRRVEKLISTLPLIKSFGRYSLKWPNPSNQSISNQQNDSEIIGGSHTRLRDFVLQ